MGGAAGLMAALSTLPQPPGFDTPKLVPTTAALAYPALGRGNRRRLGLGIPAGPYRRALLRRRVAGSAGS